MNRIVYDAINTDINEPIYFRTHSKVVYLSNGKSVNRGIKDIQEALTKFDDFNAKVVETDKEINDSDNIYLTRSIMNEYFYGIDSNLQKH